MSDWSNTNDRHNDETIGFFADMSDEGGSEYGCVRCPGCMETYPDSLSICPHCGYVYNFGVENALHLYPKTMLENKYYIGKAIGFGGFGVTYLAWDTVLKQKVAIKEYLPSEFSTRSSGQTRVTVFSGDKTVQFRDGLSKFVDEAKRLAKFSREPGIVKIFDSFETNNTAYFVMEYLKGETLGQYLDRVGSVSAEKAIEMMMPVIESLSHVHDEGIIHRDIAPDNIFITRDGRIRLIDFGAARYATTTKSRSLTIIVKPGYSPEEQYRSRGDQGTHTDVYSCGAVLYKMVTGQTPPDALERRAHYEKSGKDILEPISKFTTDITKNQETAIYNALNVRIEDRTPDMISLAGELLSEEPVKKRRSGIKIIDVLKWPLWAKIGVPSGIAIVATLCVLLACGVIGPKSLLNRDIYIPADQALVPDILASNIENAEKKLTSSNLKYMIADRIENDIVEKNMILMQDPDAGNIVDFGSVVNLTISAGRGDESVPDVVGLQLSEAKAQLEALGYIVEVDEKTSDSVAPGAVMEQSVTPGEILEIGTQIRLTVSNGDKSINTSVAVTIPDVTGMSYSAAKAALSKLDLYIEIYDTFYSDSVPENQVTQQTPVSGNNGHKGDTVGVTICKGAKTVSVPDVSFKSEAEAISLLKNKGINGVCSYKDSKTVAEGHVISQGTKAGTTVKVGASINLVISSGSTVKVPSVVGKSFDEAKVILFNNSLSCGSPTYKTSSTVAKGNVISQSVAAGTSVKINTSVTLVVSSGSDSGKDSGEMTTSNNGLKSVSVFANPTKTEYYIGDSISKSGLQIIAEYYNGKNSDVTSKCRLSGFNSEKAGSSTVKVSYTENGVTKTTSFIVKIVSPSVSLSETSLSLESGKTYKIDAKALPDGTVSWSSSNTSVATVSNGTIKGIAKGTANITAKITYNSATYSASCRVSVSDGSISVSEITISNSSISLSVGQEQTLTASVIPSDATDKILWSSANNSIATVANDGTVKAVAAGKTTITASAGEKSASCAVTVTGAKYAVTLRKGSGISSVSGEGKFAPGQKVTVSALASSGYTFNEWTSSSYGLGSSNESYTFTMPSGNVVLTATAQPYFSIGTISGGTYSNSWAGFAFDVPSGYSIVMSDSSSNYAEYDVVDSAGDSQFWFALGSDYDESDLEPTLAEVKNVMYEYTQELFLLMQDEMRNETDIPYTLSGIDTETYSDSNCVIAGKTYSRKSYKYIAKYYDLYSSNETCCWMSIGATIFYRFDEKGMIVIFQMEDLSLTMTEDPFVERGLEVPNPLSESFPISDMSVSRFRSFG